MTLLFADTGSVSFILYGIFVSLTIAAMFVAFRLILKASVPQDRLNSMIELFKYAVVTTAISTVTLVVSNLFKEREQDIKELEFFDKYVADIKQANNIVVRLQLSKYFAIVAPSGEMKKSWQGYYDSVLVEYQAYLVARPLNSDSLAKSLLIESAESSLGAPTISSTLPARHFTVSAVPDVASAEQFEGIGFRELKSGNYSKAADAFTRSENARNGFRSSYELARLLRTNASILETDSVLRAEVLREINQDYSASAPTEVKAWLREQSTRASARKAGK